MTYCHKKLLITFGKRRISYPKKPDIMSENFPAEEYFFLEENSYELPSYLLKLVTYILPPAESPIYGILVPL